MPEGPELACSRDKLNKLLKNSLVFDLSVGLSGRYTKANPMGMDDFVSRLRSVGLPTLEGVQTHGKFMWWTFRFPDQRIEHMHCTYGMAGGWQSNPSKHTAFIFEFGSGDTRHKIFFNDSRHFGTVKFVSDPKEHLKKLSTLGPCILGAGLTPEIFAKNILRKPNRTIGEALMDQSAVAGIGNYLRAEVMFDCGVDPWKNVTELTPQQYASLCESSMNLGKLSYESQGASIRTYRNVDGSHGAAQFTFKVYGEGHCPLGHQAMRRQDSNGRMVHWCPSCQK